MYKAKAKRPEDVPQFLKWVEQHFIDDIVILPRAKESLKKAKHADMEMLCDAMEVLGNDYKAWSGARSRKKRMAWYQLGPGGAAWTAKSGMGRDLMELDKNAGLSKCGEKCAGEKEITA